MAAIDYDKIAGEYARNRRVHPAVLEDLARTSGIERTSRVLEVGCGTGNYSAALQAAAGCACWGIDPSEQMLARARERPEAVHWQLGRAEQLDFSPATFDLVFSVDVIHHLGDRPAYFREAWRVLRHSGRVCTVTDSAEIICQRRPLAVYFPETVAVELARYPGIAELRVEMEQAGFHDIAETQVEFAYALGDIQAYRDKAFSSLHLIPEETFRRGIARMEEDLRAGPLPAVSRYVLVWGSR